MTDFPIAAYIFAAIFDVASLYFGSDSLRGRELYVAGTYVMLAGAGISLGAILTGFMDWWKGVDRNRSTGILGKAKRTQVWRTINWHATTMLTVTAIIAVDLFLRITNFGRSHTEPVIAVLSVVAALLVSVGSFYGGELVYDFQFNVEGLKGSTVWNETDVDQLPSDQG